MNQFTAVAVAVGLLCVPAVAPAHVGPVTTVDFEFPYPAIPPSMFFSGSPAYSLSGSFSYDASKTGVVGINDLLSFYFSDTAGGYFTLSDIQQFNHNAYFGWNPLTNAFVDAPSDLSSGDYTYTGRKYVISGYYLESGSNRFVDLLSLPFASVSDVGHNYTYSICAPARIGVNYTGCIYYENSPIGLTIPLVQTADGNIPDAPAPGVPEPATWTSLLLGLGLAGAAIRSRRRALAAA